MGVLNLVYSLILASSGEGVLNPIYEGITLVGPYAIGVVAVLSIFYGIFLFMVNVLRKSPLIRVITIT